MKKAQDFLRKGNTKTNWIKGEMTTFRFKRAVSKYNQLRIRENTGRLTNDKWAEIAFAYRPDIKDKKMSMAKTKSLFKQEEVKIYADSLLTKALEDTGITHKWLLEKRKDVVKGAIKDKKYSDANVTLDALEGYAGMKTTLVTQHEEIDYGSIDKGIEDAESSIVPDEKIESGEKTSLVVTDQHQEVSSNNAESSE